MSAKPILRYVELWGGGCGLSTDSVATIMRQNGTSNVRSIRVATEQDVAWVRGMGGHVPDGRISKATGQPS